MLLLLLNCILSLNVLHQSTDAFISYRLAIIRQMRAFRLTAFIHSVDAGS